MLEFDQQQLTFNDETNKLAALFVDALKLWYSNAKPPMLKLCSLNHLKEMKINNKQWHIFLLLFWQFLPTIYQVENQHIYFHEISQA
jgi:hypothetical protein